MPMTPRRNWDRWLVLALSLASLWPFAGALLEGRVPGQKELPIDGGNGLFIFALVQDVLLGKADLLHTEAMWFPTGRPFLLVVQNVVDAVAAQPFLLLLGPAHGLAAFTAAALVANGLAAGWMGERIGGRGWSGPAAALVLALCPYIWAEAQVGRVTQTLLFPICLAVGASWTAVESGRGAARAGGWLALAAAVYWFYGLFGAVVVAAVFLGGVVERPEAWRPRLGGLLVAALVSAAVVAPFALFNAASWSDMAGRGVEESPVPNATRIFGGLPWQQNPRIVAYVPQLLYGVGLLALLRAPRGRPLALVVATFLLCFTAHGRPVELLGVSIPSPLAALQAVPGFERFWWPNRALAGAVVALGALAALVVRQAGWARNLAAVFLVGAVAQGAWVPGQLSGWFVPAKPRWGAEIGPGALLFLPMLNPEVGKLRFAQWTWHRRPFVNGMAMWDEFLWPAEWREWAEGDPLMSTLLDIERASPRGRHARSRARSDVDRRELLEERVPALTVAHLAALHAQGVDTIVMDEARTPQASRALLSRLAGEPDCDSSRTNCVWRLDVPAAAR